MASCTTGIFDDLRGLGLRDISQYNAPTTFDSMTVHTLISIASTSIGSLSVWVFYDDS